MISEKWIENPIDAQVYKLTRLNEHPPLRYCLLCNAEYDLPTRALRPHPLDRLYVNERYCVEVSDTAFSTFEEMCAFAKEVAPLLQCRPETIIRSMQP